MLDLLALGAEVEVMRPPELRAELARVARHIADLAHRRPQRSRRPQRRPDGPSGPDGPSDPGGPSDPAVPSAPGCAEAPPPAVPIARRPGRREALLNGRPLLNGGPLLNREAPANRCATGLRGGTRSWSRPSS